MYRIYRLVVKGYIKNDVYSLKINWLIVDKYLVYWCVLFFLIFFGINWVIIYNIVKYIDGLILYVVV